MRPQQHAANGAMALELMVSTIGTYHGNASIRTRLYMWALYMARNYSVAPKTTGASPKHCILPRIYRQGTTPYRHHKPYMLTSCSSHLAAHVRCVTAPQSIFCSTKHLLLFVFNIRHPTVGLSARLLRMLRTR